MAHFMAEIPLDERYVDIFERIFIALSMAVIASGITNVTFSIINEQGTV